MKSKEKVRCLEYIVGIGGYAVSSTPDDVIKTFALSTCVGLVYYSMRKRALGMAHIQVPNSKAARPGDSLAKFADTAPGLLMQEMQNKHGLTKREIIVSLYGGIDPREDDCFKIGEKNVQIVKATLRQLGLIYSDVDTGGNDSRTLVAYASSGIVEVVKHPMHR